MIKTIYLIRHGETAYNKMGVVQGSGIDADLNETGLLQAEAFYKAYNDLAFDKVYISNLKRTFQTVESFIEAGIPFEKLEGLNEISWGEKEGKIPNTEENKEFSTLLAKWRNGETHVAPAGGESPEDVAIRQKTALNIILEGKEEENLILIAMHGRAMRILLAQILGLELYKMDEFEHTNTCLYLLEYSYQTSKFSLIKANDTQHLIGLKIEVLA